MYLSGDCDLIQVLVLHWAIGLVRVVENNRHSRLCHASLPLFVHELLQAICSDLRICAAQVQKRP